MDRSAARWWRATPAAARTVLAADFVSNIGTGLVLPFLAVYVGRVRDAGVAIGAGRCRSSRWGA